MLAAIAAMLTTTAFADNDFRLSGFNAMRGDGYLGRPADAKQYNWALSDTLRLGYEAYLGDHWYTQAYSQITLGHSSAQLPPSGIGLVSADGHSLINLDLPRVGLRYTTDHIRIEAGRLPYSMGSTLIFTPVDIFNRFDLYRYDDEKAAFWQAEISGSWGVGGSLSLAVFPSIDKDQSRFLLKLTEYRAEFDMHAFSMRIEPHPGTVDPQWIIGGGLTRTLPYGLAVRADAMVYLSGIYQHKARAAVGIDLTGANDWSIAVEYLYDGTGSGAGSYDRTRTQSYFWLLDEHYGASYLTWQATEIDALTGSAIINLREAGGVATLDWIRSLYMNLDLRATASVPWGETASPTRPQSSDAISQSPYGLSLTIKYYF